MFRIMRSQLVIIQGIIMMTYYESWSNNNNNGNQSIEAMDISLGRNTSTEDMEMDELTQNSPEFFPRFISFTNNEGGVRNRQSVNDFPKYHQVPPDLSDKPVTNTLNQGWQPMLQTLDTPGGLIAYQTVSASQSDCLHQQKQNDNVTNNNANKLVSGSHVNVNEDQSQQKNELEPKVMKPIRPLCGNTKSKNNKKNGDRFCMSCLFVFTSVSIVLTIYTSIYIQLHLVSQCYDSNDYHDTVLQDKLKQNLFGQEIAVNVLPGILKDYLKRNQDIPKTKPLVLSLHGWTGVGKNYASRLIAKSFSPKSFVKFLIPLHFPHAVDDDVYYKQVIEWVDSNITQCHINIFLFDEMDKATPGVVTGIQNAIINQSNKSSSDTPVIFLLLSNSKGAEINRIVFANGKIRSEISLDLDFKDVFADNDSWFSSFNSKNIIDHFIPFLPLDISHVKQCIIRDSKQKNLQISEMDMDQILKELSFLTVPLTSKEYSKTGCKRVSDKVDLVMYMYQ